MTGISESSLNTVCAGLTVLLVDGDSTCVAIISKMLRRFGYRVMTANRATDAFCIIRDSQCKIDLIITEGCLPDVGEHELLETIKEVFDIPVICMSADNDGNAILGGLSKGAMLYLVKPITMYDLKNIWQFAFIKERGSTFACEKKNIGIEKELSPVNASDVHVEFQSLTSEGRQNHQSEKRKRSDEMNNNILEEDNGGSAAIKKPKIIWTKELHDRFLQAIKIIGMDEAHPKNILQCMNVPGLRKENVSSHLQKYRLSLKREQDANQKTMNGASTAAHVPCYHLFPPFSSQQGSLQFSDMQFITVADPLDTNGLVRDQQNLNGCMPIPSSGSANLLKHVDSDHKGASMIEFEQTTQCNETIGSAYPECNLTCNPVINAEQLVDYRRIGSLAQFLEGETEFLNTGDSGLESLLDYPIEFDGSLQGKQQKQEQFLEGGTDILNIGGSGLESLLECRIGYDGPLQQEQFLEGETDFFNIEDSALESLLDWPTEFDSSLEEKQQRPEQFVPLEPMQLPRPPKEQEELDVFWAESGAEFTEVFTMENKTSEPFFDKDFGDFW